MLLEELDHVAVKQPGLLELAGVTGAVQDFHLAARYAPLEREGARVCMVFAAAEDQCRASDARMMIGRVGICRRLELINDRLQVGLCVALGEQRCKKVRQRVARKAGLKPSKVKSQRYSMPRSV